MVTDLSVEHAGVAVAVLHELVELVHRLGRRGAHGARQLLILEELAHDPGHGVSYPACEQSHVRIDAAAATQPCGGWSESEARRSRTVQPGPQEQGRHARFLYQGEQSGDGSTLRQHDAGDSALACTHHRVAAQVGSESLVTVGGREPDEYLHRAVGCMDAPGWRVSAYGKRIAILSVVFFHGHTSGGHAPCGTAISMHSCPARRRASTASSTARWLAGDGLT